MCGVVGYVKNVGLTGCMEIFEYIWMHMNIYLYLFWCKNVFKLLFCWCDVASKPRSKCGGAVFLQRGGVLFQRRIIFLTFFLKKHV